MIRLFRTIRRALLFRLGRRKDGFIYQIPIRPSPGIRRPRHRLAIAAIVKDEGPYLAEWIEFHRLVGCEHFILYDNDSTDETAGILARYAAEGVVTAIPWPRFCGTHNLQMLAYAHALGLMQGRTAWLAFIDADEFLFPSEGDDLRTSLARFEDQPAVAAYWTLFGTSGHATRPEGLVCENYTLRLPYEAANALANRLGGKDGFATNFKSIVQPHLVRATISAHAFRTDRYPVLAVDGARNEIRASGPRTASAETFQLNHYISKSRAEWEARLSRRDVNGIDRSRKKSRQLALIEADAIHDTAIQRFLPALRARLARRSAA